MAPVEDQLRVVGTSLPKVDAVAKVTGRTKFADDLFLPRMLHCRMLRSTTPHAEIVSIDTQRAEGHPGVVAVLVGRDLPNAYGILPVSQDEHALCLDKVRFVGDPVAAVAAIDEETAFEACELIDVEYAPLDSVADIDDALGGDDPAIHLYGDAHNVHKAIALEFGDVEAALTDADLVHEDLFFYEGSTHLPMEQHAALADYRPDDRLTLWSSSQTPHYVHRALATVLEMPASRIRVIATPNGGGFGGKSDPFNHEIVVAELSRRTGRPVKICLNREEVFYCHRGRHPTLMWIKTGFKRDGSITGMHFRSFLDGGAYGSYGVASTYYTGALQTVTYPVPAYKFEGLRVFTNKPPCGPKRGHGTPQPRFALEVHIDKVAEKLGLDPARMRLDHLVEPDSVTANYLKIGARREGAGARLWVVHLGCGVAHLLEQHAALGRAAKARSRRRRDGLLRLDRDRSGVGFGARLRGGRGARCRSFRDRRRDRRHFADAGRPRLVFESGHADDRQRRATGRGTGA
jgi:CO/xanthine dehydrogenase Mo-binding subunit